MGGKGLNKLSGEPGREEPREEESCQGWGWRKLSGEPGREEPHEENSCQSWGWLCWVACTRGQRLNTLVESSMLSQDGSTQNGSGTTPNWTSRKLENPRNWTPLHASQCQAVTEWEDCSRLCRAEGLGTIRLSNSTSCVRSVACPDQGRRGGGTLLAGQHRCLSASEVGLLLVANSCGEKPQPWQRALVNISFRFLRAISDSDSTSGSGYGLSLKFEVKGRDHE